MRVTENLSIIRDLLTEAANQAERDPATVHLLAVSKKQPIEAILEAAAAGQRDFGENYVQEGLDKIAAAGSERLIWHFIGHLQSNKTRAVAEHFDWVHTIDRLKIARRLSDQRPAGMEALNICLQVDIDNEASKSGATVAEVPALARAVSELPNVRLRGLMCLPAQREGFEAQREPFRRLHQLAESIRADGIDLDTLSMGMTGDYRAAIAEGATMVRIGTAIFGPRE
ncbi:MAG: YggS family pyridoxal phosphate-dependent enzyme [Woeseiaceae bacterium]|nr:YggS family pyridoxal phosphate-dependent enzyme [Woeseiaceae bacterium]